MRIFFNIDYQTHWGEQVCLTGDADFFDQFGNSRMLEMQYTRPDKWTVSIELPDDIPTFNYRYAIRENNRIIRDEWGKSRPFTPSGKSVYRLYDHWQELPVDQPFYSSAFSTIIFAHPKTLLPPKESQGSTLTLQVWAPETPADELIAISGKGETLGNWNPEKALPLSPSPSPLWTIDLDNIPTNEPLEYKFLRIKKAFSTDTIVWEEGRNRTLKTLPESKEEQVIISGLSFRSTPSFWRGAGVAIPLFSLRSRDSFGIGDFLDLKKLADWATDTGQKVIQILPINDTTLTRTWTDSYPYNANSIFALHPLYLNLYAMGVLQDKAVLERLEKIRQRLNERNEVDYEEVLLVKWDYFRAIYEETGYETLNSTDFKTFFEKNREWLEPYAAFCYLRDLYKTADFRNWPKYSSYEPGVIAELCAPGSPYYKEIALHYFLQYHLHIQLKEACRYIREKGLVLKGDIPIGISRDSVDAWSESHLFNIGSQAGAPPDAFSFSGQNWGFPTYNWNIMEQDGYAWWKKRFRKMAEYFDAYRIDHILGFFRIWEIPSDQISGLLGHFNPALPISAQEIEGYGCWFDEYRMTHPYIRYYFLSEIFGEYTDEVIHHYLNDLGDGVYSLKNEFQTQKQIEIHFKGKTDPKNQQIKNGLYHLVEEVLFVRDPYHPQKYHPRISAQYSYSYKALDPYQQACFNRLYDEFFYYRHNEFWKNEALKKLPVLISATSMLVCAEDLGMIPHSVPEVMNRLKILSLEIQRMSKHPQERFANTDRYPYLSVCSTSTHDMAPLRVWWEEDRSATQYFYNHVLHETGEAPFFCEPWICERIIDLHLRSSSMLAILPLQDWLSIDGVIRRETPQEERINIPANPRHYWRYRMHLTLEELINCRNFNRKIRKMITESGR